MKNPWIVIIVLTVVLFGGAVVYSQNVKKAADEGVVVEKNVKGNPDSEVVLMEFSDFQCPACGQFYPVVKQLMDEYGDQVRFEYRHFPLTQIHPYAEPAARAAEAAGQQGKFFEYHDKLFENQQTWSQSANPNQYFLQYAEELELDMDQFVTQQSSALLRSKIQDDMREGLQRGVQGTPTFYLNDTKLDLSSLADLFTYVESALGIEATTTEATAAPAAEGGANVRFGI